MNNSANTAGRCTCGEIHYELTASPLFVHCCHCSWCQRETGSAFAINALIESRHIRLISGHPEIVHTPSNSGNGQNISRCPTCKTAVWSHYGAAKEAIAFIRVGTLNNPNNCPPDIHIFTSTKQAWVKLDDSTPVMPEYYQRSKYWPENSIARYKQAIG
ncbi:GFA family protein [Oceanicoccus sp. KOV_DT_Chl]|uniref:GFA family protein n=1 Tax=Oceanicoccus sp. KOV_DT_Chl TaxID=1904639 RepID=UPI000C7CB19E|nr:GFA family protein [Oceanicoccus sp. KOV_DT_Chl]